ncbi:MAG: DUF5995 family protein [Anaerolineae bacterium]|nr:DUF5995 family protein [Anaerolineae bacterium]
MTDDHDASQSAWFADDLPPADRLEVTRRMAGLIREWEGAADRRAFFLSCYALMTRNVLAAIDAGDFHDPAWVSGLLDRFADYYFAALECDEDPVASTPDAWRLAFDAARDPDLEVMQHLLLGINAHINYDLVLCLGDVLTPEWHTLSDDARHARYLDHCHINGIIGRTIDAVQDEIVERYSPWMATVDASLGRLDEWLVLKMIARWRDEVWTQAVQRVELPDETAREAQRREIEESVVSRGHLIRLDAVGMVREMLDGA